MRELIKVHISQENKTIRRIFVMEMKNLHKHNLCHVTLSGKLHVREQLIPSV